MNETIYVGTGSPFGDPNAEIAAVSVDDPGTGVGVACVGSYDDIISESRDTGLIATSRCTATSLMRYLDANRPEGKMCLSNMECQQIDDAWDNDDWETIIKYIDKYRKQ